VVYHEKAARAKLFTPFDALRGFREALLEKERIIVPKIDLSEEMRESIDRKLHLIHITDIITVIYFNDGEYIKVTGMVSKFSETNLSLTIVNTIISFNNIYDIQGNCFPDYIPE